MEGLGLSQSKGFALPVDAAGNEGNAAGLPEAPGRPALQVMTHQGEDWEIWMAQPAMVIMGRMQV
jgi:hypothetical protein